MTRDFINLQDFIALSPEIFLALSAMLLLVIGAFVRPEPRRGIFFACGIALILTIVILYLIPADRLEVFYGAFVQDGFSRLMKTLVLFGAMALIFVGRGFLRIEPIARFEFPILVLFSTLGMMIIISAHDFITMYLGLELQSLALYVLTSFDRRSVRSSEAGIKYFLLGALSSGILLYGCGLIYGFAGTLDFTVLKQQPLDLGAELGIIFVLAGLAFKIGAVPFHMWTPDVYEGAPAPVAMFFASTPKIAAMAVLARIVIEALPEAELITPVVIGLSVLSMALGAFAAIVQSSIRRLIAYSSIGHAGYILIGIATASSAGIQAMIVYLAIYIVSVIGLFCCVMALRRNDSALERISDLSGLSETNPVMAFFISVILFSMAGIPPLAGFFAKFYIFSAAISAGFYALAIFAAVISVVAAYYYLRIVKMIYFDEPEEPLDVEFPISARVFMGVSGLIVLGFVISPKWLVLPAALVVEGMLG